MRALLQRVLKAHVVVEQSEIGTIGAGWLVLLGVGTGRFQANMKVTLVNDGPVTVIIDSPHDAV